MPSSASRSSPSSSVARDRDRVVDERRVRAPRTRGRGGGARSGRRRAAATQNSSRVARREPELVEPVDVLRVGDRDLERLAVERERDRARRARARAAGSACAASASTPVDGEVDERQVVLLGERSRATPRASSRSPRRRAPARTSRRGARGCARPRSLSGGSRPRRRRSGSRDELGRARSRSERAGERRGAPSGARRRRPQRGRSVRACSSTVIDSGRSITAGPR